MKKAQITIFIIIGLVAVISASFLIYSFSNKKIMDFSEQEDTNIKELSPIKVYVEEAVQTLLLEGLFLISKQGGKIYDNTWPDCKEEDNTYLRDDRMCLQKGLHDYSYPTYLSQSPYNHKRVAIGINSSRVDAEQKWTQSSKEPLEQPFAYPHVGKFLIEDYLYGLNQPLAPINYDAGDYSIEAQLSRWIENHLLDVIDFTEFEKMGFDITLPNEPPSVRVKINENNIIANMDYNITVDKSNKKYLLNEFYSGIDSNFRQLYFYANTLINIDISSLADIKRVLPMYAEVNGEEQIVGGALVMESIPPNHKYDIMNVTTTFIDYTKEYGNYPDSYLRFYFIRENRAPDASTVYTVPTYTFNGNPITWYCPNYKTAGKWFDPDEDDETTDEFPFTNPQWYQWYSRGDKLITEEINGCQTDFPGCPYIPAGGLRYHNEPNSKEFGPSWTAGLNSCGNSDDDFTTLTSASDVGDIIILKVGDSQDFPKGTNIVAPTRYPDSPILESGFGRLNDLLTFRPVKCEAGSGFDCDGSDACSGGYWRFNAPPVPETETERCVQSCTLMKRVPQSCSPSPCTPPLDKCEPEKCICSISFIMTDHVDHTGTCVKFDDRIREGTQTEDCSKRQLAFESYCAGQEITQDLCSGGGVPQPQEMSPEIYQDIIPKSCANEDGYCQDQGIPIDEDGCGDYEKWVYLSTEDVIEKIEECKIGTCFIRGKEQEHNQNYFSCAALCKETGECDCPDGLDSCSGDFDWEVLPE